MVGWLVFWVVCFLGVEGVWVWFGTCYCCIFEVEIVVVVCFVSWGSVVVVSVGVVIVVVFWGVREGGFMLEWGLQGVEWSWSGRQGRTKSGRGGGVHN